MNLAAWEKELAQIMPEMIALRRELHRHPEVGGEERQTKAQLQKILLSLGMEVHEFADCEGLMGILRNGEGRCIAVRADMDALPVKENTGLPFASECDGVMHACGHDAHMALAVGSAMWLCRNKDRWHGTVKYLFEPAEETFGGGQLMTAQGCMEHPTVDCVIGQHMNPRYDAGVMFAKPGFVSGSSDEIRMTVRGKNAHGAYPEAGVDAIVIAANVVTALQSLVSRTISPFDPAVVTIGEIHGGAANNIICGEVFLHGTLRTLSPETRAKLKEAIARTAQGVTQAMGGTADVEIVPGYGAVYNDDGYYTRIECAAEEIIGRGRIVTREAPSLGVESFCYFVENTPGVYYDLGCGVGTALHTDTFTVDESCLLPGVALQCAAVLELLKEE
ncbi:MAG: amidohydrolase [Clostridia bacterium]|nr:amidohydrolase [Clostridia bacterium]